MEQHMSTVGAVHSHNAEEGRAFVEIINDTLRGDPDLGLPLETTSDALIAAVARGLLLAYNLISTLHRYLSCCCGSSDMASRTAISLAPFLTSFHFPRPGRPTERVSGRQMNSFNMLRFLSSYRKFVNKIRSGVIDERKINKRASNSFEVNTNLELSLRGCKEIGIKIVNIGANDLRQGIVHLIVIHCHQRFQPARSELLSSSLSCRCCWPLAKCPLITSL